MYRTWSSVMDSVKEAVPILFTVALLPFGNRTVILVLAIELELCNRKRSSIMCSLAHVSIIHSELMVREALPAMFTTRSNSFCILLFPNNL